MLYLQPSVAVLCHPHIVDGIGSKPPQKHHQVISSVLVHVIGVQRVPIPRIEGSDGSWLYNIMILREKVSFQ